MASDLALPEANTALHAPHQREGLRRSRPPAFAAIDLGTNNCRMLIGVPSGAGFHVLDGFSRVVRLGEGLYRTGLLSASAMDRAIEALQVCAERLKRWHVGEVRAIATEACRQAENGVEFIARARAETGLPLETISPREEVGLAVESCATLICQTGRRALLFDIGGGSTELAWVRIARPHAPLAERAPQLVGYHSIPVGVVTLTERCNGSCDTEAGFGRVVRDIMALLQPFEAIHHIRQEIRQNGVRLVGTSGTVTTLAGIVLNLERYRRGLIDGTVLSHERVEDGLATVMHLGREGLSQHPCIGPDRVDFVLPGCAIFAAIAEMWPAPELVIGDRGLREGMLLRMIRTARGPARRFRP